MPHQMPHRLHACALLLVATSPAASAMLFHAGAKAAPRLARGTSRAVAPRACSFSRWTPFGSDEAPDTDEDPLFLTVAAVPPIAAFALYGEVASAVRALIDNFGFVGNNVDGNDFANTLLRPAINGVVVPTLAIAAGTLLATTINVLRERQVDIRSCINKEACTLRLLRESTIGIWGTVQHAERRKAALGHLAEYTSMLISESDVGATERLENLQDRQTGGISDTSLNSYAGCALLGNARALSHPAVSRPRRMLHGIQGVASPRELSVKTSAELVVFLTNTRCAHTDTSSQILTPILEHSRSRPYTYRSSTLSL
jgi:hypothetical protein